ncbi:MAG: YdaU family protein [Pseudomonadota bacterium]
MSIVHIAFYPSDWLAGTRGLSAEESGVYITLICRMYEMAGPIERDDQRLARLCGCKTKNAFVKALEYLISEGKIQDTENRLFNERAQKEIKNATQKSDKAKQAAQSRWDKKPNKNNGGHNANASPKHMPEPCYPEPESYTLPNGSDGDAVDFTKEVFDRGVAFLGKYGTPEPKARALIGKWRKQSGDEETFNAFRDANRNGVTEPVAWITARLKAPEPTNYVPDFDLSDFEGDAQ